MKTAEQPARNSLYNNAILLLTLTALFWGGNTIAGRLAIGEVSPLVIVALRWIIVSTILCTLLRRQIRAEWSLMRPHLVLMVLMALFGFISFNTLFYFAAHTTTAVNLGIIQASMPAIVLIGSVFAFGAKVRALQVFGIIVTMVGVAVVATQGDLAVLTGLKINPGDGLMIIACLFYAGYTVALRARPKVSGLVFFAVLSAFAAVMSLPALAYEISIDAHQWPTFKGWLVVLYISLFPSCLAQIFFMRGVELIGPSRAGIFINLVPIFAAILAVLILQEPFRLFHAVALALVLGGIWFSERKVNGS